MEAYQVANYWVLGPLGSSIPSSRSSKLWYQNPKFTSLGYLELVGQMLAEPDPYVGLCLGLYRGYKGVCICIMEKKMETTISGFRVKGSGRSHRKHLMLWEGVFSYTKVMNDVYRISP